MREFISLRDEKLKMKKPHNWEKWEAEISNWPYREVSGEEKRGIGK